MTDNLINIKYKNLNLIIIIIITSIIILFSLSTGGCLYYIMICYITSISLGLIANSLDLNKSSLMGVLIIPSIITYLGVM